MGVRSDRSLRSLCIEAIGIVVVIIVRFAVVIVVVLAFIELDNVELIDPFNAWIAVSRVLSRRGCLRRLHVWNRISRARNHEHDSWRSTMAHFAGRYHSQSK